MTFYQELQLSSVGSKQLIKNTADPKEKHRHILIYNFKVYLVMAFCVAVVSIYSKLTGNNNSVVGGGGNAVYKSDREWQQRRGSNGTACSACASAGGFRNQNDTWTIQYRGNFCDSYDCTAICQHP